VSGWFSSFHGHSENLNDYLLLVSFSSLLFILFFRPTIHPSVRIPHAIPLPLSARRFSRIRLVPQPPTSHPPLNELGFDPLINPPSLPTFLSLLSAHPRSPIKSLLLDQSFAAGVGNWVADEVLYHARVHPARVVDSLSEEEAENVWRALKKVVEVACEVEADSERFPSGGFVRRLELPGAARREKLIRSRGGVSRLVVHP
jgi:formamidopyrimidine-DNA glycosylase